MGLFGNLFGSDIDGAAKQLKAEFGITLDRLPEPRSVREIFDAINEAAALSEQARIALLYRLVLMNYLGALSIMRDQGQAVSPMQVAELLPLSDRSVDWSELAPDHVRLEMATSTLNQSIERLLASLGVHRGSGPLAPP